MNLLQGTLDLLILKALALDPLHGLGISRRIEQVTAETFQVKAGSLFPALHRMEEAGWIAAVVGRIGKQTQSELLPPNARREKTAPGRDARLGANRRHHWPVLCREARGSQMRPLRRFILRLTSWARSRQDEERLQAEIDEHLDLETADNIRAGLSPEEARRQALLKFGAVQAMKESYRD